ncbi:MAG: SDR family oxidoreductase [Candidatus Marinimicrobia bacterium]|nr:SDR family oxidoreductase [Candidatus Neomarinimicrobiota bacterium]MBT4783949.1 SDR family oxidoreductase [Candidatus Neomarinimicrobiota bacterium]MBT5759426.1 SDR family oxidoreductase [Candidatus Neomarinimicrobiota bacterium]MBT6982501.1 SDR family oxidoreductase [Candidatus Neomarinimicrobiota bacterium]MBT7520567.1 SDR family oxidoreductase [Candidatus Neomarinimicrobiota bacterium]
MSKHLAVKGYNVTVFDSYRPSNYNEWILLMDEIIIGDISDESAISRLADKNFDIVIHLISLDHYKSENDPNFVSSINVMPTWNLLDSFTKNGLKRFIYFSTIHVYGNLPSGIITEDQIPQPSNAYGLTHLLSENICNYYNEKTETECINVRLSNTYGSPVFKENNCWWLVINDLCKTAVENNEIRLKSDGSPQRDFIHGDDVAKAIDILINYKNNTGDNIFHIASGQILTILELAHRVKSVYTKMYDKEIDIILPDNSISEYPDSDNSKDIDRYVISTKRLKNLGFKQGLDLELGINEIFYYLKIGVV